MGSNPKPKPKPKPKKNADPSSFEESAFCDFCGMRNEVAVSDQVQSGGVRICDPCARWAVAAIAEAQFTKGGKKRG